MIPTPEQLDLEFFPTIINGKPEAIYLVFRRGIRAKKTLRFHNDHGHRLNIDVGSDGLPIAMELIGGAKPVPGSGIPPQFKPLTKEQAARELFAFCCSMIYMDDLGQTGLRQDMFSSIFDSASSAAEALCPA